MPNRPDARDALQPHVIRSAKGLKKGSNMSSIFGSHFSGVHKPKSITDGFVEKFATRIKTGLFPMASARRNHYDLVEQTDTSLHFCSIGLLTSWNIGLNNVRIQINREAGEIRYDVRYDKWSKTGVGFGVLLFIFFVLGQYIVPANYYPPKSYQYVLWPFVGFWCFVWPWILTAMHRGPAAKCLTRILDEVNTATT